MVPGTCRGVRVSQQGVRKCRLYVVSRSFTPDGRGLHASPTRRDGDIRVATDRDALRGETTMSGFGFTAQDALSHQLPLLDIGEAVAPVGQIDSRHRGLALPAVGWLLHQQRLVPAPAVDVSDATAVFRKEAEYWTLRYDGRVLRLRDLKGLRYLASLLADPGHAIHVADLLAESGSDIPGSGVRMRALSDAGVERLDPRARDEYRRRLADLREEVGAAEADHDIGRLERLRAEMDFIVRELCAAYGLGGRTRRAADRCERIRKGVTNRIREAIARIRQADETLARHLTNSLRLGVICVYQPERPVWWDVG